MLRALVLVLALANIGFWAWSQGWLDHLTGIRARGDREPERLARQVHPERIVILPAASGASAAVAAAPACLEAGPFDPAGYAAAETALAAVQPPIESSLWTDAKTSTPGSWILYMGRFESPEALAKKEEQLKRYRNLEFQEVQQPPELAPGLSLLGPFDDRDKADKALTQLGERGIRSARVVETVPATTTHWLRFERADAELATRLAALKADTFGKGFAPCLSGESR